MWYASRKEEPTDKRKEGMQMEKWNGELYTQLIAQKEERESE